MTKIGRNDPCWCGSGKKYKKCHAAFDAKLMDPAFNGHPVPDHRLILSAEQIEKIKASAAVNKGALDYVAERIGVGTTTQEIDDWVHEYTVSHGAIPAPLNYEGYPKSVCTSIDEVVCHGIPSSDRVLKEGEIVNVDCSTILDGYYSDSSRMFCIGEVSPEKKRLVEVTREAMYKGLEAVKPYGFVGDIGAAVKAHAEANGYSVVRELGGHGVGLEFHDDPFVSHVADAGEGMVLVPGMMFTIEPMINMGEADVWFDDSDGWTVRTVDGQPSAQWEIQVLVTTEGYEVISD